MTNYLLPRCWLWVQTTGPVLLHFQKQCMDLHRQVWMERSTSKGWLILQIFFLVGDEEPSEVSVLDFNGKEWTETLQEGYDEMRDNSCEIEQLL